jgi:hypothetical protein
VAIWLGKYFSKLAVCDEDFSYIGLDRKQTFSSLATWQRCVKLGGYMAWLVFFQNKLCDAMKISAIA